MSNRPAVFLDRDDTLIVNTDLPGSAWGDATPGDLLNPALVRPLPGVVEALRSLKGAGFALVIVTNQGGVARGHGSLGDMDATNDALRAHTLGSPPHGPVVLADSLIDACYACPFHPAGVVTRFADEHPWRKPAPGMILAAAHELGLDLSRSWLVGDAEQDVQAGLAAGIDPSRAIRLGEKFDSLGEVAKHILGSGGPTRIVRSSAVTLRVDPSVASTRPFDDERVRESVVASARAIAERTGVELLDVRTSATALTAVLACDRIVAMGFASELRRASERWYRGRFGGRLWLDRSEED